MLRERNVVSSSSSSSSAAAAAAVDPQSIGAVGVVAPERRHARARRPPRLQYWSFVFLCVVGAASLLYSIVALHAHYNPPPRFIELLDARQRAKYDYYRSTHHQESSELFHEWEVRQLIKEHRLVMFSERHCPDAPRIENLLRSRGLARTHEHESDDADDAEQAKPLLRTLVLDDLEHIADEDFLVAALADIAGVHHFNVPFVFWQGRPIGGLAAVSRAVDDGVFGRGHDHYDQFETTVDGKRRRVVHH